MYDGEFCTQRSHSPVKLAQSQDVIGWDNFLKGKISAQFATVQRDHLLLSGSTMVASDWTTRFITRLLHLTLTHGQWLYRNISRNHHTHGLLIEEERKTLLREIDTYMHLSPEEVPDESKFLLEIDFKQIRTASTEKQSYWVHAV